VKRIEKAGTFQLGSRKVTRLGYGAMQLAGPGVFGPPKDREAAVAVLREAVFKRLPGSSEGLLRLRL
jgi:hypothetical protein